MRERLHRTQLLLEPEQHRALAEIARCEGRSISGVVREMISEQLDRRLEVETFAVDADQCHSALRWAERLGQTRAYDSFYMALAETRGIPLWTADKRLANTARQAGITWVHSVG